MPMPAHASSLRPKIRSISAHLSSLEDTTERPTIPGVPVSRHDGAAKIVHMLGTPEHDTISVDPFLHVQGVTGRWTIDPLDKRAVGGISGRAIAIKACRQTRYNLPEPVPSLSGQIW
jgi:hypothetical protein